MELPSQELTKEWNHILKLDAQVAKLKEENTFLKDRLLQIQYQVRVLMKLASG